MHFYITRVPGTDKQFDVLNPNDFKVFTRLRYSPGPSYSDVLQRRHAIFKLILLDPRPLADT